MGNFKFLKDKFPILANLGDLAEKYLYTDANSCLIKLGMIGENIVNLIFEYDKLKKPAEDKIINKINILVREGLIDKQIENILHALRKTRNKAVHENFADDNYCEVLIEFAYTLSEWFMQTYGDYTYKHHDFVLPRKKDNNSHHTKEQENEIAEQMQQALKKAEATKEVKREERLKLIQKATAGLKLTEAQTRYIIDMQLKEAGWQADTNNLRYSKGTRPKKNANMAIAEWPTLTDNKNVGHVDYALFIGLKLVGVIEAKSINKNIPSVLDYQCKEYAKNIIVDEKFLVNKQNEYKAPFAFATNGRPYIKQLETMSGIWCANLQNKFSAPKALNGFMSPEGILNLIDSDIEKANKDLISENQAFLTDKEGLNLRYYQINAIRATVDAIVSGKRNILLAMATGTGKTRTILGMIYLFLKAKRFHRILFLVDRTSLGEQALDTFKEVKLEDLMTLDQIYAIKGLEDKTIERETKIQIATVQSMVKRLLYFNEDNDKALNVSDFDLIIVDEAHRGYILDKQMTQEEMLYNNQKDYISKYRYVIDYFDAVKIGLTATPALHTTEIFGNPVFTYSYREAVNDRYLVDHDVPHEIRTKLYKEGITYKKGDEMVLFDTKTNTIENTACIEDEIHIEVDKFNREVITEGFNRAVLEEIIADIAKRNSLKDETKHGKVLIFAVDDIHADLVVKILKEICPDYNIDSDEIIKITASAGEGNKARIAGYIRRFKNENSPSIVVTVDLLSTGIDVPKIDTLVFLRRVKSRILFEQMLGRATRLCPQIDKTCFEIYDPVGVYEAMDSVNTMKPVAVNPKISISDILNKIKEDKAEYTVEVKKHQIEQLVAKLNRRQMEVSDKVKQDFKTLTGKNITQFIDELKTVQTDKLKNYIVEHEAWFNILLEKNALPNKKRIVYEGEDEVISHTRDFGDTDKPQDYIESFTQYLKNNMNEVMALKLICTKPSDLKREDLKKLRLMLDASGFSETHLNTALNQMTNKEITADIISLIRQCVLGSARISHEERIKKAMERLRANHYFDARELSFLQSIEKYLIHESVINVETFDSDMKFKKKGGFKRINKIFNEQLEDIIIEINQYLYDDGGKSA